MNESQKNGQNRYIKIKQSEIYENKEDLENEMDDIECCKTCFIYSIKIIFFICFGIIVYIDISNLISYLKDTNNNINNGVNEIKLNSDILDKPPLEKDPGKYTQIKKGDYTDYYRLKELKKVKIIEKNLLENNLKNKKINIHVAYGLNNIPLFPVLVSMSSIMENLNKEKSIVTFHLLLSSDFKQNNIMKLKTILKNYPKNTELFLYNMTNVFEGIKKFKGGYANYYRLLLGDILSDINKVIYLDSDTLAFKDITGMYLLNCENYYMMGFPDFWAYGVDYLGVKSQCYICSGVLLLNLEKMRKDNKTRELIQFTITRNKYIRYYDQNILNYILYPQVGALPFKYGIFNFHKKEFIDKEYLPKLRYKANVTELYEAMHDPSLVHYTLCNPKIYKPGSKYSDKTSCKNYQDKFYYYANKTDFYKEIYNLYMKKNLR